MSIKVDTFRDGGTVIIQNESVTYCIDRRIGTETKNRVFTQYPLRMEAVMLAEADELRNFVELAQIAVNVTSYENQTLAINEAITLAKDMIHESDTV